MGLANQSHCQSSILNQTHCWSRSRSQSLGSILDLNPNQNQNQNPVLHQGWELSPNLILNPTHYLNHSPSHCRNHRPTRSLHQILFQD